MMSEIRCSICDRPFDSQQSTTMPFCSERCRLLDLNRWLEEGYGLASDPEAEAEDFDAGG